MPYPALAVSSKKSARFMSRQGHLVLRKGDPIANVRMDCLRKNVMKDYFDKLKETLEENDLMKNPTQIYNVDETRPPPTQSGCH